MRKKQFTLIRGGKFPGRRIGIILVRIVPISFRPKIKADVMVFEEDTNLIMTIDDIIEYRQDHPIRLLNDAMHAKKQQPGSLVAKGRSWYAVVIDIDQDPPCRVEWIIHAYGAIYEKLEREGIGKAALFLLGSINGGLAVEDAMLLCLDFVSRWPFTRLRDLTILVPDTLVDQAKDTFERFLTGKR